MIALLLASQSAQVVSTYRLAFVNETAEIRPVSITANSRFKISIFNGTSSPMKIPGENSSLAYGMFSFTLTSPDQKSYEITRRPRENVSSDVSFVEIASSSLETRDINFADNTWQGFPAGLAGQADGWMVRVKMSVDAKSITGQGFWAGQLSSGPRPAKVLN